MSNINSASPRPSLPAREQTVNEDGIGVNPHTGAHVQARQCGENSGQEAISRGQQAQDFETRLRGEQRSLRNHTIVASQGHSEPTTNSNDDQLISNGPPPPRRGKPTRIAQKLNSRIDSIEHTISALASGAYSTIPLSSLYPNDESTLIASALASSVRNGAAEPPRVPLDPEHLRKFAEVLAKQPGLDRNSLADWCCNYVHQQAVAFIPTMNLITSLMQKSPWPNDDKSAVFDRLAQKAVEIARTVEPDNFRAEVENEYLALLSGRLGGDDRLTEFLRNLD